MEENKNPQPVNGEETEVMESPVNENENKENEVTAEGNSDQNWKSVMLGGIPGILLGVGGVFAAQAFTSEGGSGNGGGGATGGHPGEEGDIPVANSVNDSMSFREAFAAAREEVGPGGAFAWHGNVYSTYRSDDPEWVQMGPDGQAAHCHDIVVQVHAEPYTAAATHTPTPEPAPDPDPEPQPEPQPDPDPDPQPDPEPDPDEADIQILGVEVNSETGAAEAYGYVNGHETQFLDVDGDNQVDMVLHDVNDDGEITPDEVEDVTGSGITIDGLSGDHVVDDVYVDNLDDPGLAEGEVVDF